MKTEIKIGEGYRKLRVGEKRRVGDEFFDNGIWERTIEIGQELAFGFC